MCLFDCLQVKYEIHMHSYTRSFKPLCLGRWHVVNVHEQMHACLQAQTLRPAYIFHRTCGCVYVCTYVVMWLHIEHEEN
jgi:hypothetical protein